MTQCTPYSKLALLLHVCLGFPVPATYTMPLVAAFVPDSSGLSVLVGASFPTESTLKACSYRGWLSIRSCLWWSPAVHAFLLCRVHPHVFPLTAVVCLCFSVISKYTGGFFQALALGGLRACRLLVLLECLTVRSEKAAKGCMLFDWFSFPRGLKFPTSSICAFICILCTY